MFPGGAYDSVWDSVLPMTGNFPLFPVPVDVGCIACCMAGSAATTIFAQVRSFFSRFKLKDKCRSAKWEVYLDRAHDHQGGP